MTASEIILQKAITQFINERKATKIMPSKSDIFVYARGLGYDRVDNELCSVVMSNPYTGEDVVCVMEDTTAKLSSAGRDSMLSSVIGNPSRLFADIFDLQTHMVDDETETLTLNGAGALIEVILDNIQVFDDFYKRYYEDNSFRYDTMFDMPGWLTERNFTISSDKKSDNDKVLEELTRKHWIDSLKGKSVFIDRHWNANDSENWWWAPIIEECGVEYDEETGVMTETYDCTTYRHSIIDEEQGGFGSTHICGLMKAFVFLMLEKCNIRVVKTTDAIPGYSSEKLLEGFEKREYDNPKQTNRLINDHIKTLDDAKHYVNNLIKHFNDCMYLDLLKSDKYGYLCNAVLNANSLDEVFMAIKYNQAGDFFRKYLGDQIFKENYD